MALAWIDLTPGPLDKLGAQARAAIEPKIKEKIVEMGYATIESVSLAWVTSDYANSNTGHEVRVKTS